MQKHRQGASDDDERLLQDHLEDLLKRARDMHSELSLLMEKSGIKTAGPEVNIFLYIFFTLFLFLQVELHALSAGGSWQNVHFPDLRRQGTLSVLSDDSFQSALEELVGWLEKIVSSGSTGSFSADSLL